MKAWKHADDANLPGLKIDVEKLSKLADDFAIPGSTLAAKFDETPGLVKAWDVLNPPYRTDINYLNFFVHNSVINSKYIVAGTSLPSQFLNLSVEDLTTIYHYTDNFYYDLNAAMRNLSLMNPHFRGFGIALNNALDKLPNYSGITHRGATIPESVVFSKYKIAFDNNNGNIIEEAFTSTSKNADIANSFSDDILNSGDIKVFFTINGNTGKDIDMISKYGPTFNNSIYSEAEVLFKSGTTFKVTNFQDITTNGERFILITLTE